MKKILFLSLLISSIVALSSQHVAAQQYWQCSYQQDLSTGAGGDYFSTNRSLDQFCWNGPDDQFGRHITYYSPPTNNGLASPAPYDHLFVDGGDSSVASVDQAHYYGGRTRIIWKRTGKHTITQRYVAGPIISFLDQDVWVTDIGLNSSSFTLTNTPTCPTASPSFTINRTYTQNTVKNYFVDIYSPTTGQYWQKGSNGWTAGDVSSVTVNPGIPFQAGATYVVKLAISDGCNSWQEYTQNIVVKSGYGTPKFTINNNTTDIPVQTTACGSGGLSPVIQNLSTTPCNAITAVQFQTDMFAYESCSATAFNFTNAVSAELAPASSYNLFTVLSPLAQGGLFQVRMRVKTSLGWSAYSANTCVKVCATTAANTSDFALCSKTLPGCNPTTVSRQTALTPANAVVMGPTTCGIKIPQISAICVDQYEVKLSRIDVGQPAIILGTYAGTVGGTWGNTAISFNSLTSGYFFSNYTTFPANTKFKVELRTRNACGWETWANAPFAYFYITSACGQFGRLAGSSDTANDDVIKEETTFYPNPTTGSGSFVIGNTNGQVANLEILDMSGRLVRQVFSNRLVSVGEVVDIDLADLPNGLYFYRLSADKIVTGKIIKQQ